MTTYSENAIALDAAEEAVIDTRVIDVDFGAADSDVNEKTMHGNLVYDMAEEEAESELAPDPEVYEAARRIDEERWFYRFVKRAFDIVFSLAVLILFCWLFAIIAIAIKIDDPKGPVIFKQERIGWSIIGQKLGAVVEYVLRPALSALEVPSVCHSQVGLGVAA